MRFAKIVFWSAGIWGVLALTPLYFMLDTVGLQSPPPVTHPEFYFGFLCVALTWQFAFMVIAIEPARYRPIMIPAIIEKLSYVITMVALYLQKRVVSSQLIFDTSDLILGLLFVVAFFKTSTISSA